MYAGNNGRDCNFFESIHRSIQQYATNPKGKAKRTIPQIMAKDYNTSSNTRRVWLKLTEKGSDEVVERFAIIPDQVRRTNKLELVAVEIQGPDNSNSASSDDGDGSDGADGDNGDSDGGASDQGDESDENDEDSEDDNGNEDGDNRGDHDPDGMNDGEDGEIHMSDDTASDNQDDSNDNNDTDDIPKQVAQLRKQLRTTPGDTFRDNLELRKHLLALSKCLQPTQQPTKQARKRLFGRQLPSKGLGEGGGAGPSDRDDGE